MNYLDSILVFYYFNSQIEFTLSYVSIWLFNKATNLIIEQNLTIIDR